MTVHIQLILPGLQTHILLHLVSPSPKLIFYVKAYEDNASLFVKRSSILFFIK